MRPLLTRFAAAALTAMTLLAGADRVAAEAFHLDGITISATIGEDPGPSHFHKDPIGRCDLLLWITADGIVRVTQVIKSSGHVKIDDACLQGVAGQRLEPAHTDSGPLDIWAILPLSWDILTTKPPSPVQDIPLPACLAPNQTLRVTLADYPKGALQRSEHGVTRVHAEVSESGQVLNVSTAQSSGSPDLDQAALAAIRAALFSPAFADQKPVPASADVVVAWVLPNTVPAALPTALH